MYLLDAKGVVTCRTRCHLRRRDIEAKRETVTLPRNKRALEAIKGLAKQFFGPYTTKNYGVILCNSVQENGRPTTPGVCYLPKTYPSVGGCKSGSRIRPTKKS